MPERLHAAEQIFEPVEDSRKEELRTKLERLDEARSRILADAGARVLTKGEKKAIMRWMKSDGKKEEAWPLDDNITRDNYQARLAPYGVLDLVNPDFITGKNDVYNLVNRQYVTFLQELRGLERLQPRLRSAPGGEPAPVAPEPPPSSACDKPEPKITEEHPERSEPVIINPTNQVMSWKVWEMLMAMLHAMQKHPDRFEALRGLTQYELDKKLSEEGPKLLKEYIHVATRGEMEWDDEKKMWDVLDQTKLTNLDVKVGIFVLQKAGFNVKLDAAHFELVPPGTEAGAKPFVLQFDTMDTPKRKALEADAREKTRSAEALHIETQESPSSDLKEGEYRITIDHHTDDPKERKTSAAELLYNYIWIAGGIAHPEKVGGIKRDPVLERLLAFTNAHDNGEFPADKEFFRRSANTLWGIGSDNRVSADVLYRIMERGRDPKDPLTEEDLDENIGNGKKVRDLVAMKHERNERDAKSFDRWANLGYIIETDYGPLFVCLEVPGRYMPKQSAAKSYGGVPNVLIWSPEKHSFFIALGSGKAFKDGVTFQQKGTEIIRRHLAIFKRQARTPQELTASLLEILWPFSPQKKRSLAGDLRAYVFGIIGPDTSNETLFSIYSKTPEKQDAVIEELVRYPKRLSGVKRLITETSGEAKRIYKEMFDRAQQKLTSVAPVTEKSEIEVASDILADYKA